MLQKTAVISALSHKWKVYKDFVETKDTLTRGTNLIGWLWSFTIQFFLIIQLKSGYETLCLLWHDENLHEAMIKACTHCQKLEQVFDDETTQTILKNMLTTPEMFSWSYPVSIKFRFIINLKGSL